MSFSLLESLLECTEKCIEQMDTDSSDDEEIVRELLCLCNDVSKELETKKKKERIWVKPWRKERSQQSSYSFLTRELRQNDKPSFCNYLRMNETSFELLLSLIQSDIVKKDTLMRDAISPAEKLAATLRYLATGESLKSTDYQTYLSQPFLTKAVPQVCQAIWKNLKNSYLKFPSSKSEWVKIADEFAIRWQFPNCLGALDGKHIPFKSLRKDGAFYHNYKGSNSIVLLALADANCAFIYVDIGCNGRTNDAGVLLQSTLKKVIDDASKDFPNDKVIGNERKLPYVIVGDDAFPLQKHLIKPYPYATPFYLTLLIIIINIILSRARHVIEHAFGILSQRFRIFQTTIDLRVENVEIVTQACCVLHNFLLHRNNFDQLRFKTTSSKTVQKVDNPNKGAAERIRQAFTEYFVSEGKVDWQHID